MPLIKSKSDAAFKQNVHTLMDEWKHGSSPHVQSQKQALAIAYATKRRGKASGGKAMADGGDPLTQGIADFEAGQHPFSSGFSDQGIMPDSPYYAGGEGEINAALYRRQQQKNAQKMLSAKWDEMSDPQDVANRRGALAGLATTLSGPVGLAFDDAMLGSGLVTPAGASENEQARQAQQQDIMDRAKKMMDTPRPVFNDAVQEWMNQHKGRTPNDAVLEQLNNINKQRRKDLPGLQSDWDDALTKKATAILGVDEQKAAAPSQRPFAVQHPEDQAWLDRMPYLSTAAGAISGLGARGLIRYGLDPGKVARGALGIGGALGALEGSWAGSYPLVKDLEQPQTSEAYKEAQAQLPQWIPEGYLRDTFGPFLSERAVRRAMLSGIGGTGATLLTMHGAKPPLPNVPPPAGLGGVPLAGGTQPPVAPILSSAPAGTKIVHNGIPMTKGKTDLWHYGEGSGKSGTVPKALWPTETQGKQQQKLPNDVGAVQSQNNANEGNQAAPEAGLMLPGWSETTRATGGRTSNTIPYAAPRPYALGGIPTAPWWERREAASLPHSGPIMSSVPGRTDRINMNVKSGSYVLPSSHVSYLGQDNTMAGIKILNHMFGSHGGGLPKPPPMMKFARGGEATGDRLVPIIAAGGEYVLTPEQVAKIGKGDVDFGHKILDHWVVETRKKHIKKLASLAPPAKD